MKNKTKTLRYLMTIILAITITISFAHFSTVNAQNFYTSYVYTSVSPLLVGVGQDTLIVAWTADMPPDIGETAGTVISPSTRAGWHDIKVIVTTPSGTNETIKMPYTDPVGATWFLYTTTEVGTYYVQAYFPATWKNSSTSNALYSSAISISASFTVQQEPIKSRYEAPLPNDYWTRPLNAANRDWYKLAGNWLSGAASVSPFGGAGGTTQNFGYGMASESAHILWSKPYWAGGIMDERFGDTGYATWHYQGVTLGSPIIINGVLICDNWASGHTTQGWNAINLYTGQTILQDLNTTKPTFGQIYNYESPNQHGGFPYLWRTSGVTINNPGGINGTVWEMLDATTYQSITKIANVTSGGTAVYGKDGSILRYNLANLGTTANPNYYLQVWNTSAAPSLLLGTSGTNYWQWRPARLAIHDGNTAFSLNTSIPIDHMLGPRNTLLNQTSSIQAVRQDEYLIIGNIGRIDERGIVQGYLTALSLEPGKVGAKLWNTQFSPPFASQAGNVSVTLTGVFPEDEVILFESAKLVKRWGYDMKTGQLLWESEPEPQLQYYHLDETIYQGKLFSHGYSGILIAYNMRTGAIEWTYNATNVGFESPYGNFPIHLACVADGKLYLAAIEHSPTQPLWRGPNMRCINASNGAELWKIMFMSTGTFAAGESPVVIVGDGIVVSVNYYDMQIYAFGRGPSQTTVTASPKVSVQGSSVMVEGTVTDQSPSGKINAAESLDFSLKDSPAISDEDMGEWMEYKFMQQPMPEDAKGVEVTLTVLDPNNNVYEIGRTTSDKTGIYGYAFKPEVPGTYQIIATFAGSKSYGPSAAATYITVDEVEPTPTQLSQQITQPPTELYFAISTVVIVIAISIVGILNLRKRA